MMAVISLSIMVIARYHCKTLLSKKCLCIKKLKREKVVAMYQYNSLSKNNMCPKRKKSLHVAGVVVYLKEGT